MRILLWFFMVFCCLLNITLAQEPPREDRFSRLIEELGSAHFQTREAAFTQLEAEPTNIAPQLEAALKQSTNAEVTRRLEVLLERRAEVKTYKPTLITLKVERKPLKEVFQQVAEFAGCKVNFTDTPDKMLVSFDWVKTPLLKVLDELNDVSGYTATVENNDPTRLLVSKTDNYSPHVSYEGPFSFMATHISVGRSRQLGMLSKLNPNAFADGSLNLNIMLSTEPGYPIVGNAGPILLSATDDQGRSLTLPQEENAVGNPQEDLLYPAYRTHTLNMSLSMFAPSRNAETIKSIKAKLKVLVLVNSTPILTIPKISEGVGKKFDTPMYTVELRSLDASMNPAKVNMSIRYKGRDEVSPYVLQSLVNRMHFYDADGSLLEYAGSEDANYTENSLSGTFQLVRPTWRKSMRAPKPTKFILWDWTTRPRIIECELKDIPLP